MYRYFAVAFDPHAEMQLRCVARLARSLQSIAPQWHRACDESGLMVWHSGAAARRWHAYSLAPGGAILGLLFRRCATASSSGPLETLDRTSAEQISRSAGRHLVEHFWGRYVAFVREPGGTYGVLRDPTGALPCMQIKMDGITVVFSHLEDLLQVVPHGLSINWRHLQAFLLFDRLVGRETGLNEVTSVLAGEYVSLGWSGAAPSFYWDPNSFCRSPPAVTAAGAAECLRDTTVAGVRAWARGYGKVLLELSGGLDSAIVLGCLRSVLDADQIVCLNLYSEGPEGDERRYARAAAAHAGCRLVEHVFRSSDVTPRHMVKPVTVASPMQVVFGSVTEEARDTLAHSLGAQVIFSGQGGDHLFRHAVDSSAVAEYVSRHGWGPAAIQLAAQVSARTAQPIWSVLHRTWQLRRQPYEFDPYRHLNVPSFMITNDGARRLRRYVRHPWAQWSTALVPAKRSHVFGLIECQTFYMRSCSTADCVHPLISQPLIEQCLQLPTHMLTSGGLSRALARQAFARHVPPEILARTSKGGSTGYVHGILLDNAAFIREVLLDGMLVRQGLIDRRATEQALTESQLIRGQELGALLAALRAEIWLDRVKVQQKRIAA